MLLHGFEAGGKLFYFLSPSRGNSFLHSIVGQTNVAPTDFADQGLQRCELVMDPHVPGMGTENVHAYLNKDAFDNFMLYYDYYNHYKYCCHAATGAVCCYYCYKHCCRCYPCNYNRDNHSSKVIVVSQ